jgi:hypothetical protein
MVVIATIRNRLKGKKLRGLGFLRRSEGVPA